MVRGRQKDYRTSLLRRQKVHLQVALCHSARRRSRFEDSEFCQTKTTVALAVKFSHALTDYHFSMMRNKRISELDFSFNFNAFTNLDCLHHFRFEKRHVSDLVSVMGWPPTKLRTTRNRYRVTPILATCTVLRRLSAPARWRDLEELFGKHGPQLSEIFWEAVEFFLDARKHLVTAAISQQFIAERAELYSQCIHDKGKALTNCIGFIDGTVLGIARPSGSLAQRVAYNGHKRKHAIKYQAVNTPNGLIQHVHIYRPLEGRRHDWTLYVRSKMDEILPRVLAVQGKRYCIYGDSGYNQRWFIDVPFQGSNVSPAQSAFNRAMSSVRISVEWIFKEVKMQFPDIDFKRKMKIQESPVGMMYLATILLTNFRNCLYPNQISTYFECSPPDLKTYVAHKN